MPNVIPHPYEGSDVYCEHCALPPHNRHHIQHAVIVTPPTGHEQVVVGFDTEQEAADWAATHVPRVTPGPQPWKTCVVIHESVYDTDTER